MQAAARLLRLALLAPCAVLLIGSAPADTRQHEGVASCASSTCHGRQEATGPRVRQNEVLTWQDPASLTGAHSRAWSVLAQPRGQAIGRRLGIANVQASAECILCHGDPAIAREPAKGPGWQQSDGVGCEACHGGATRWLASHAAVGATHAQNVARGMTAIDRPSVRAGVCLDCHWGSSRPGQFVPHRVMAAGHPRLTFELDLFTALQSHHDEDADYAARKGVAGGIKVWAVGQAMAVERALAVWPVRAGGSFPEFGFFDCRSCHRSFSDDPAVALTARINAARPIPPGQPVWNDENMLMLSAAAKVAAPAQGERFDAAARAFHTANGGDRAGAIKAAAVMRAAAADLAVTLEQAAFSRTQGFAMIDAVLVGSAGVYTDYQGGAQAVMAADTLLSAMVASRAVDRDAALALRPEFDRAYAQARDANSWRPEPLRAALARIAARIRALQ